MHKFYLAALSLLILNSVNCINNTLQMWDNMKTEILNNINLSVLYEPIASECITNIPIIDCKEELIDLNSVNDSRIQPMSKFDSRFEYSYSGYSLIRISVYEKLIKMLEFLPKNIGIVYSECFRPLWKQKEYFDKVYKEKLKIISDRYLAYEETSKLVSPFIKNIPVHCTGAAIDMTLFIITDDKEELMDMGEFDVVFGKNNQHETFSQNTTTKQRKNRLLLLKAASEAGLVNYGYEWWHFSYGDKPWAYVKGKPNAIYGLIINENLSLTAKNSDIDSYIEEQNQDYNS
jgi:zinc D-Ala-D-Ala dipeptidase